MKKLNILFLLPRYPFPLIGGDRVKPFYLLKHLGETHNVTVITFFQGEKFTDSLRNAVEKLGVELHVINLNPVKAGVNTLSRIFSKKPLEILYYHQMAYQKKVNEVLEEKNYDIAFSFFMRTAEYLKDVEIPKILMAEDCRTIYQRRSYEGSDNLKQKLIRWWEWNKLKKYEPKTIEKFDAVTLVSNDDIKYMKGLNPSVNYRLISNGVDVDKFIPDNTAERKNILFTGKFDVWANELMTKRIVEEILPIIKIKFPDIKLILAGANPTKGIKKYESEDVEIHANVPEIVPYLQNAAVYIHPHYGGSGIQNKLLEAMSAGCPVVTTDTGNQGIYAKDGEQILLANSSEEIAKNAINILSDKKLAKKISENARQYIIKTHSWESIFQSTDNLINETCEIDDE